MRIKRNVTMINDPKTSKQDLLKIQNFLAGVNETNEATAYNPVEEGIVNSIIQLVREKEKTSITEDFDIPYLHPMITIQKWSEELKEIVDIMLMEEN